MAIGSTLGQIVVLAREEAGQTTDASLGQNTAESVRTAVRRTYRRLHAAWQWPHLRIRRTKAMQAGTRYYAFPTDLDPNRIEEVWARESNTDDWHPVAYNIGLEHLNSYRSDLDERSDPVWRWMRYGQTMFEVWPIPESNNGSVQMTGFSKASALVADSDTVDLDDTLVSLYVAAELLARKESPDAKMKLQQADILFNQLKTNSQHRRIRPVGAAADRESHGPGIVIRAPGT